MSKQKVKIIPEKIHLVSVNIIKANLETSDDFLDSPKKIEAFEFGIANEVANNFEEGRSRFRLYFTLDARDKNENPLGVKVEYGIEFHFLVENFQDFIHESKEAGTQVDIILGATLFGMAYSTARGIIFERTRGTFFDGVVLPVIDPIKFLLEKDKEKKTGK